MVPGCIRHRAVSHQCWRSAASNLRCRAIFPRRNKQTQTANFIVDATGLSAAVTENPLLKDLIERYQLPLINKKSLKVSNEFEITSLASSDVQYPQRPNGRMYAAGVTTLGGPYAAVDSFLGLQYAALRTVTHLTHIRAEGLRTLGVGRSGSQWLRWVTNQTP